MWPVLRKWKIFERNDFSARGEQIREELGLFLEELRAVKVLRFEEQRDRSLAREHEREPAERLFTLEDRVGDRPTFFPTRIARIRACARPNASSCGCWKTRATPNHTPD